MSLSPAGRRQKGHDFERFCAEQMRELGWTDCCTTRAARGGNWCMSDDGIDLCGTSPWAVQCKRGKKYARIAQIEEIQLYKADSGNLEIPLLLTKADGKPTMAVLPFDALKKLLKEYYRKPE